MRPRRPTWGSTATGEIFNFGGWVRFSSSQVNTLQNPLFLLVADIVVEELDRFWCGR